MSRNEMTALDRATCLVAFAQCPWLSPPCSLPRAPATGGLSVDTVWVDAAVLQGPRLAQMLPCEAVGAHLFRGLGFEKCLMEGFDTCSKRPFV